MSIQFACQKKTSFTSAQVAPGPVGEWTIVVGRGFSLNHSKKNKVFIFFQGKREDENQNLLRKAELPVVSKKDCQKMLRKTRLGKYFRLHESFLCAGGDELDLCVVSK